jgi:hypothetical protein
LKCFDSLGAKVQALTVRGATCKMTASLGG